MEFDKSKILTCVTADQAKVGQMGWFGFTRKGMEWEFNNVEPRKLVGVRIDNSYPFHDNRGCWTTLFYPAQEPTIRPYTDTELNDLVGEVLTNKRTGLHVLVTRKPRTQGIIMLDGSAVNATQLLESFYRNDNEPCGMEEV